MSSMGESLDELILSDDEERAGGGGPRSLSSAGGGRGGGNARNRDAGKLGDGSQHLSEEDKKKAYEVREM